MSNNSNCSDSATSLILCFRDHARRRPDNEALITPGNVLTYRQLDQLSSRVAALIHNEAIGPADYVGVHTRSPELNIIFLLGVFKSHGIYVNLHPDLPSHRLDSIREQLGIKLILGCKGEIAINWYDDGQRFLATDLDELCSADIDFDEPCVEGDGNYVVMTSGTTGKPRLVLGRAEGIYKYLGELQQTFPLESSDSVLGLSSLVLDGAFREVFAPLTRGARLVMDYGVGIQNPVRVMELINQFGVSVLPNMVPSRLRAITDMAKTRGCRADSVRLIMTCGESLLSSDINNARHVFGAHVEFLNQYGVSEYSMAATWKHVRGKNDITLDGSVLIGSAVGNVRIFILDDWLQPVPVGTTGEICLSGPGLALGYPADPAGTVDRFIEINDDSGSVIRTYRTGDLARCLINGDIQFLGRKDDEISIHGLRVNPLEVESVIKSHDNIENCAVVSKTLFNGDTGLVAYVVKVAGSEVTTTLLRQYLDEFLLPGAIPARFIYLDSIPLKLNGKVDRDSLPDPGQPDRLGLGIDYVEPETATEQKMTSIWRKVLGVKAIGKKDPFFALGGDSITLFSMLNQVELQTGIQVPLNKIMNDLTIDNLAIVVDAISLATQQFSRDDSI